MRAAFIGVLLLSAASAALCADYGKPGEQTALPKDATPEQLLGIQSNGYALKDYENFFKEWPLVTVRYREDTGEIRLTYANELALKGLNEGKGVYEDGSVFAKIGFMSKPDPGFASSLSPLGARRYQLMIKNSKKHTETDGWGYALFNAADISGIPRGENTDPKACQACHQLVPERGYVFSIPMTLNPADPTSDLKIIQARQTAPNLQFYTTAKTKLPPKVQELVRGDYVRLVHNEELTKHAFGGTVEETIPFLIREVQQHNLPAILVADNGPGFALVQPDPEIKECKTASGEAGVPLLIRRAAFKGIFKNPVDQFCAQKYTAADKL
jgi:hypothetical protein